MKKFFYVIILLFLFIIIAGYIIHNRKNVQNTGVRFDVSKNDLEEVKETLDKIDKNKKEANNF